jgi:hypothetical protein
MDPAPSRHLKYRKYLLNNRKNIMISKYFKKNERKEGAGWM